MLNRIRIDFRCGRTAKRFTVNFLWSEDEKCYLFESVIKGVPVSAPGAGSGSGTVREISANEFIWAGYNCPYGCQKAPDGTTYVRCGCGGFACAGGLKNTPGGGEYFTCQWCRESGEITGTIDKLQASPVTPGRRGLGPGRSQDKLDGPSQKQLR